MLRPIRIRKGFTLIELLVVITIIVVLLALLTPALEKAVYQAQLAVCGTKHRTLGGGVMTYAVENKRAYPYRPGVYEAGWFPRKLSYGTEKRWDDRIRLRPYISINDTLNCPLVAEVDIEGSLPESHTHSTYNLWFGWQYIVPMEPGMLRIGDRWEWYDKANDYRVRSSLLSSTTFLATEAQAYVATTHAGSGDDYVARTRQDRSEYEADVNGQLVAAPGTGTYTYSAWYSNGTDHSPIDMNAGFDDLSVQRYNSVAWKGDQSMARVPLYGNSTLDWDVFWMNVPKQ